MSIYYILSEGAKPPNMGRLGFCLLLGSDCQLCIISPTHLKSQIDLLSEETSWTVNVMCYLFTYCFHFFGKITGIRDKGRC